MGLRDPAGRDAIQLDVPDLGPGAGQVVLAVDEAGVLTWHFPLEGDTIQPPAVRGAGGHKRFLIPRAALADSVSGEGRANRSFIGALGKKLLKVIVYPITDAIIGKPAKAIAEHWEKANRAYGLRRFTPDDYRQPTETDEDRARLALTPADVDRLGKGRALLFLHGTFSTAHGAFADISPQVMEALYERYGGRTFAFNHFTLSHGPDRNVREFIARLKALVPNASLDVDVVCHSRGGLVARTLDLGRRAFDDLDTDAVRVRRIVFVGVPNKGTLLAHPDHMVHMIDRLTNGLNLLPPTGVADVLEGLLIAIKIIGHGALKGLDGLQAMNPQGGFLKKLNQQGPVPNYFAIAANYEPTDPGLRGLVGRGLDAVLDRIFKNDANDLVVPEGGVFEANGCEGFPIADVNCLRLPAAEGVMHTRIFRHPEVERKLEAWVHP